MKKPTSYDVAAAANVSQSTVSRALAGGARVSVESLKRIREAAESLNYRPNELARSLISGKSNMIGIVMGETMNPFYPMVLSGFTRALQDVGRRVMLFSVPEQHDVDEVLPQVLQYQVAGVIIASATISSRMVDRLKQAGTPTLLFNRSVYADDISSVCCANADSARLVANRLLEAGHRSFAFIGGQADTSTHIERRGAFVGALRDAGMPVEEASGSNTYEGGYAAARRLLAKPDRPEAILCVSDISALGALEAARHEFGLRVPEDLSIVGFDDIPAAAWPSYRLTTVRQPVQSMIAESIALMSEQIENPAMAPKTIRIPGKLVVRDSARI